MNDDPPPKLAVFYGGLFQQSALNGASFDPYKGLIRCPGTNDAPSGRIVFVLRFKVAVREGAEAIADINTYLNTMDLNDHNQHGEVKMKAATRALEKRLQSCVVERAKR